MCHLFALFALFCKGVSFDVVVWYLHLHLPIKSMYPCLLVRFQLIANRTQYSIIWSNLSLSKTMSRVFSWYYIVFHNKNKMQSTNHCSKVILVLTMSVKYVLYLVRKLNNRMMALLSFTFNLLHLHMNYNNLSCNQYICLKINVSE